MVFLTYSVAGVVLPSLMTKYVPKSMMVGAQSITGPMLKSTGIYQ